MKKKKLLGALVGLALMLGLTAALGATAYASSPSWESGDCIVNLEGNKLVVSKKDGAAGGAMADYTSEVRPWDNYRESIKSLVVDDGVTRIGNSAFFECWFSDVSLPQSLRGIGDYAFSGCTSITDVAFPKRCKEIGEMAFSNTPQLNTATFEPATAGTGARVTIGRGAFYESGAKLAYSAGGTGFFDGRDMVEEGTVMNDVIDLNEKTLTWAIAYPLWVGGIRATDATLTGDGWSYDPKSNTLTLNGAAISGDHENAAIYCADKYDDLIIDAKSPSTVTGPGGTANHWSYGIYAEGGLVVKGRLTVAAGPETNLCVGVKAVRSLTVSGGASLTASGGSKASIVNIAVDAPNVVVERSGELTAESVNGIYSENGSITVNGKLTAGGVASGEDKGIGIYFYNSSGAITVNEGGELTVTSDGTGIETYGDVVVNEGAKVSVVGRSLAIDGMIRNAIPGRAWYDAEGTGPGNPIAINTAGQGLTSDRKLLFPDGTAAVTNAPKAKSLTYSGSAQTLVTAGKTSGGTMNYALGKDAATAPTTGWSASLPKGTDAGTYYVWYKAAGDTGHFDSKPACAKATIAKKSGSVGKTTIRNTVANTSKKSNDVIYDAVSDASGYDIAYKHRNSSKWIIKDAGKSTRATITGLSVGGLYEIKVRAKRAETANVKAAAGAWSSTVYRYFYTTRKIKLSSGSKGNFTMSWAKDAQATGYQVMFTTNKNGSGAAKNINTMGKNATSFTKKGLKSGTTYYVQVRELKKVGTTTYVGNISVPVAVKVK